MNTVSFRISMEQSNSIVSQLTNMGYDVYCIPGSLQDNFICDLGTNHHLKMGRFKMRKYVLIREIHQNEWSSGLDLELTDDDSVYKAWMKHYEKYMEEMESESA